MNPALQRSVLALAEGGTFWLPESRSTTSGDYDALFHFIYYLTAIFFVGIVVAMILFVVRYRRRRADQRTHPIKGNVRLEIAWTVIPGILLMVMFVWGFKGYLASSAPPADALEVRVTGQRWSWTYSYPTLGVDTDRLVVPVDRPVRLTMSSIDVIHSFFVPAFRIKRDVLPNRYTVAWFEATEVGEYDVLCAEYCGAQHSAMLSTVEVVPQSDFVSRVNELGGVGLSPVALGERLFQSRACIGCHANQPEGGSAVGPSLWNIMGRQETMQDGSTVVVDENYLRQSIMDPNSQVVAGYTAGIMPTFAGQLDESQINALLDYIKTLDDNPPALDVADESSPNEAGGTE